MNRTKRAHNSAPFFCRTGQDNVRIISSCRIYLENVILIAKANTTKFYDCFHFFMHT